MPDDEKQDAKKTETKSVKCDNHPDRDAKTYGGGEGQAFKVNLCDECTPSWFQDESAAG